MTKNAIILFLLFLGSNVCFAQEENDYFSSKLDSLDQDIEKDITGNRYAQAIQKSRKLIELAKAENNYYYVASAHNNIGHSYIDLNDSIRAKKNYLLGLKYSERSGIDQMILRSNNNLGNIYSEIPAMREKGISYYNKVIALAEKGNDTSELIAPIGNIAWTYLDIGEYSKAYNYLEKTSELLKWYSKKNKSENGETDMKYLYSNLYKLYGRYFSFQKKYDTAHYFFENSIILAEEDSLLIPTAEAYRAYSTSLREEGNFEEALIKLEKFNEYNSTIFESERLREMERANARYNLSQYQNDLKIAKREQRYQEEIISKSQEKVLIMVLSSIVLVSILFFLNKINRDRKKLIGQLQLKNKQFKEKKEEAEKLSLLKTKFFSTVSHEIRTPLYGVIGLTSLLLEDKSLKKHKTDLKSLKFSADYLLALINDVLQMNKMESNEVKLENVSFNIRDLVNSIMSSFEFTRVQNKNKVNLVIDDNIPNHLIGDSVRLSQVLMNLIGNSMKFTERGLVEITLKQKENTGDTAKIYFEVKDNGPGIPESKKKIVFEEFSQLDNTNYNYQGTGLGLPIVKKLLHLFGSKINLKSSEGEGARFYFSIDFKIDHSKKAAENNPVQPVSDELNRTKHILIVDDNRINQVVTKRVLNKKNFECTVAQNGQEAIDAVRGGNFDLVLMDVNMPGISGLEATQEIRKFNNNIPVLALTAVEVEEIREEILAAGMNDIVIKPYDVQKFYQIIYKYLSLKDVPSVV